MAQDYKVELGFKDSNVSTVTVKDETLKNVNITTAEDSYTKALEANGLDVKVVKQVEQFNEHYLKDTVKLVTEHNTGLYKNGVDITRATIPFGINSRNHITVDSRKEDTIPFPGKSGEFIKGPTIKVAVKTNYTKVSSGYIKSMKDLVKESLANG